MLRHHFDARRRRLERLVAKAEQRVRELDQVRDETPLGRRLRTIAARTLMRHRQSLANLLKQHGGAFGVTDEAQK
jgi:hypothetical protein